MSHTRVRRLVGAAAAAGALLVLTAACGGHDTAGAPRTATSTASGGSSSHGDVAHAVDALATVQKRTDSVYSARTDTTTTMGSEVSMRVTGSMDWSNGMLADLQMTYTGGSSLATMQKAGMASMKIRYLPDAYYVDLGPAFAKKLGGKEWFRYDSDDLAKFSGASGAVAKDQLDEGNPTRTVDIVLASPDVRAVGQETVRGVPATHYRGTLDVATVTRQSTPHLTAAQFQAVRQQLTKAGITTETVDLWVSKDNLPVESASRATSKQGLLSTRVFYSDYGLKVHVAAPPASQTTDFSHLLDQAS
ncbi:hypothetical protein [Streptomyces sp. CA2R106]|uniref:hypothetical protein n=1 Tax=Streptomyces sp. CA2R106 TaxID=3120153 RepID=UPI0030085414